METTTTIHINIDIDIKIAWPIKVTEVEEKVICPLSRHPFVTYPEYIEQLHTANFIQHPYIVQ
jgi:hypothetical protein